MKYLSYIDFSTPFKTVHIYHNVAVLGTLTQPSDYWSRDTPI